MAQQSEANYFALHLPALAPALRDKLEKWGSRECRQLSIEPEGEGVNIYVERKAKTTALKLQRNVRGIAANSGAPLPPTLGKGWLVPLSPEEWNARGYLIGCCWTAQKAPTSCHGVGYSGCYRLWACQARYCPQ